MCVKQLLDTSLCTNQGNEYQNYVTSVKILFIKHVLQVLLNAISEWESLLRVPEKDLRTSKTKSLCFCSTITRINTEINSTEV